MARASRLPTRRIQYVLLILTVLWGVSYGERWAVLAPWITIAQSRGLIGVQIHGSLRARVRVYRDPPEPFERHDHLGVFPARALYMASGGGGIPKVVTLQVSHVAAAGLLLLVPLLRRRLPGPGHCEPCGDDLRPSP